MGLKITCTDRGALKLLWWLIAVEFMFVVSHVLTRFGSPDGRWAMARGLFNLDSEASVPTWFSSIQLFCIAAVLFAASNDNSQRQYISSKFLVAGSLVFAFLSADEGAGIHERITAEAKRAEASWLLFQGNYGGWIAVYSAIAVTILIVAAPHFRRLWMYFRRETLIGLCGAAMFVVGAVALEIVSYLFLRTASARVAYHAEVAAEEFLEMSGASVILYGVLLLAANISASAQPCNSAAPLQTRRGL